MRSATARTDLPSPPVACREPDLTSESVYSLRVPDEPRDTTEPNESEQGVDLTLIRWMLLLTPVERLKHIESVAQSLRELRELNREH